MILYGLKQEHLALSPVWSLWSCKDLVSVVVFGPLWFFVVLYVYVWYYLAL